MSPCRDAASTPGELPDRSALAVRAGTFGSATLHEAAGRVGALSSSICTMTPGVALAGWAFPVVCPPGDNLFLHQAVYAAQPGDVLMVDVSDGYEFGYWGEILSYAALHRGLAGLVIDGGVRDTAQLPGIGVPIHARRRCIQGTVKDPAAPGALNTALVLGGVFVQPGDLVVGDEDGVVVLPRSRVESVLEAAEHRLATEAQIIAEIQGGARTLDLLQLPTPVAQPSRAPEGTIHD